METCGVSQGSIGSEQSRKDLDLRLDPLAGYFASAARHLARAVMPRKDALWRHES